MRHAIAGSFLGFVCAAALVAACGSGGDRSTQATVDELALRVADLEQQLSEHETDAAAHQPVVHTLGVNYVISLVGSIPPRNLQLPGDPGAELSSTSYAGAISPFGGTYAPRGWAFCHGQLVQIATYPELYAILGTAWGGDGVTDFALPDLRGRVPVGAGTPPGRDPVEVGQQAP